MKKFVFLLIVISYNTYCTDLKVGNLISPLPNIFLGQEYEIIYQILNINKLLAEQYTGSVTITNTTTQETELTYTGEYSNLKEYDSTIIKLPIKWEPSSIGTYSIEITVTYEYDIDKSNNSKKYFVYVEWGKCISDYFWHHAPEFKIITQLKHFPDSVSLDNKMKPGDIIGFYCNVEDIDCLIGLCKCNLNFDTRIIAQLYDEVNYVWTLTGQGHLIKSDTVGNSIFYKIPECPVNTSGIEKTIQEEILLVVKNNLKGNSFNLDEWLTTKIIINISYCPERDIKSDNESDYGAIKVQVNITPLKANDNDVYEESFEGSCNPLLVKIDDYNPITVVSEIKETIAPNVCPDYSVILSAEAIDEDRITMECQPKSDTSGCTVMSDTTFIIQSPLKYTWYFESGLGEFPMGNVGSSVVLRKSESKDSFVKCEIRSQSDSDNEEPITLKYKVNKAKKPKAFVGLGDDENTGDLVKLYHSIVHDADDVYGGKSSGFYAVAESMKDKYAAAGFDVTFAEYTSVGLLNSILEDPCYQAFCVVSHGTGGDVLLSGGSSNDFLDEYTSFIARKHNEAFWGCGKNPSIRDVQLLACNALDSPWDDAFNCNARIHGYKETKILATLRFYAYWQFIPLKPLTLALP